jgi:hypothetical protein
MTRRAIAAVPAVIAAVAFSACGSSEEPEAAKISPAAAKASVERAAHVKLASEPVPAEAREEGMTASFSNTRTIVKDKQAVALFVLDDSDVADEVSERVRESAPKSARLISHGQVLVVYAAAGADRAAAVERAVEAL